jgi:TRAP-type C4-dicarboxylate transport system substrate-binding protein
MRRLFIAIIVLLPIVFFGCSEEQTTEQKQIVTENAVKPKDPLANWQPSFDPSKAEHTYLLSCIGHPSIEGVAVGFQIRDEVWKRTGGRLYVDYRPLAQMGGEKDVLRKLQMGAVQGMLSSSVAAANLDDRLGLVNLPFMVDTAEKLEHFRNDPELFQSFGATAGEKGILVADFTGYGGYGWASDRPVETLEEARGVNFRIAQAPVNTSLYKTWGMKFTIMPWPDVPQALQTGVIDGLDHTPIVCSVSRKFDNVKNFTFLNYAQGLYIHLINQKWLQSLPDDLRDTLLQVVAEQSTLAREATGIQEAREIAKAKTHGVHFHELAPGEREKLQKLATPIYTEWAAKIGEDYLQLVQNRLADN